MTRIFILVAAMIFMSPTFACGLKGHEDFASKNKMCSESSSKLSGGITEVEFHQVLDRIEEIYAPIFLARGKSFKVERNWLDNEINAHADQRGNIWEILMYGGLARHKAMSVDGFALVACHEIGHHLGGAPLRGTHWFGDWGASESQADYFAVLKCLRKYLAEDDNIAFVAKLDVPDKVTNECRANFSARSEVALCQRSAMAGLSVVTFDASLFDRPAVSFDTPDTSEVSVNDYSRPDSQCRLDTYFAASLCNKSAEEDIIDSDINSGQCARVDGYSIQARPTCWYKPAQ